MREKKDLSINQLALYSGVSAAHISRIERGLREPSPDILRKLSDSLKVPYEDLMITAGYIKKYSNINDESLRDDDFDKVLPVILKYLTDSILKHHDTGNDPFAEKVDLNKSWEYLSDDEKSKLLNSVIKEIKYNKNTGEISLIQYFDITDEAYHEIRKSYLDILAEVEDLGHDTPPKSLEDYIQEAESLMLYGEIVDEKDKEAILTAIKIAYETAIKKNKDQNKDNK